MSGDAMEVRDAAGSYVLKAEQEVPEGYKRTEVGVIPDDWELSNIGKWTRWLSGGTPNRGNEAFWNGHIPWISGSTLKTFSISTSDQFITDDAVAVGSKMAPTGAVLLLVRGSALHKEIRAGVVVSPVAFNQDVKALIPSPGLDSQFLAYYLLARECDLLNLVSSAGNSAGVLDTVLVKNFTLLVLPLEEQRAIATALSDVDALITALDKLIAKKRAIKTAAMQQLLTGKTRLPGFSGEWETKRLGEVLTVCHGKNQREVESPDGPYPILASGGEIGRARRPLYDKPSVLIGRKGTIDRPQYMNRPFWTVDTLFYTAMKGRNVAQFFYYRFCLIDWMQYNEASGVPSLNSSTIESIEICCPLPEEQTAIAQVLSDMDAEIAALEARRDKTRAIKQGMMQQLLTGRVRLVKPDGKDAA